MFWSSFNDCINLATSFTLARFPEEARNYKQNRFILFEVSEMVADELSRKHNDMFIKPYIEKLVDVNDLAIGDKNVFYIAEV